MARVIAREDGRGGAKSVSTSLGAGEPPELATQSSAPQESRQMERRTETCILLHSPGASGTCCFGGGRAGMLDRAPGSPRLPCVTSCPSCAGLSQLSPPASANFTRLLALGPLSYARPLEDARPFPVRGSWHHRVGTPCEL